MGRPILLIVAGLVALGGLYFALPGDGHEGDAAARTAVEPGSPTVLQAPRSPSIGPGSAGAVTTRVAAEPGGRVRLELVPAFPRAALVRGLVVLVLGDDHHSPLERVSVPAHGGVATIAREDLRGWLERAGPGAAEVRLLARAVGVPRELAVGYLSGPVTADAATIELAGLDSAVTTFRALPPPDEGSPLSLELWRIEAADPEQSAWLARTDDDRAHFGRRLAPGGMASATNAIFVLLPGRWRVAVHHSSLGFLATEQVVELVPGEQVVELRLPALHDLVVSAPGLETGARLTLRRQGAPAAGAGAALECYAYLDSDHRALFAAIPAGLYGLAHGHGHAERTVAVPCGVFHFDARPSDAFEVRLDPSVERGDFAAAGLRSGDVLLEFDGQRLTDDAALEAFYDALLVRTVELRFRRGRSVRTARLGPMPATDDPWRGLDADLVPAWRE